MRKAGIARGWRCAMNSVEAEYVDEGQKRELTEEELHLLDIGVRCGVLAVMDILNMRMGRL